MDEDDLIFRQLGPTDYAQTLAEMKSFTAERDETTIDEIWITEHPPVFTLGLNGKKEHLLQTSSIPLIRTDRGGQITYHGPGQLVIYFLIDLIRRNIGVKTLVNRLETLIIRFLHSHHIDAVNRPDAPGVYVNEAKIAALGLKIRKGRSYHGLSINNCMDLAPFGWINPCGYKGLKTTQLKDQGINLTMQQLTDSLIPYIKQELRND